MKSVRDELQSVKNKVWRLRVVEHEVGTRLSLEIRSRLQAFDPTSPYRQLNVVKRDLCKILHQGIFATK
jgi:hypothetical protein